MEADFRGYATKANLLCSDGRTILPDAFKHQDKTTVPLVWQHGHADPEFVLGHVDLENRPDGVYAYAFFNNTKKAIHAKELVDHKDIRMMSIWANELIERSKRVMHGVIREVSLVLSGANPGALIESVSIRHGNELVEAEDEAIIYTGLEFESAEEVAVAHAAETTDVTHAAVDDASQPSVQDVYDSMTEDQKDVVHFMVGEALQSAKDDMSQSATDTTTQTTDDKEGNTVTHNVFEAKDSPQEGHVLTHDAMKGIFADAAECGSFKKAVDNYVIAHGITDIEALFPEARAIDGATPAWITRQMEWVGGWLGGTRKSPFSRIKSHFADLTFEDARAKGYIKGTLKKEQFFATSRRETTPKTIYKKQKLDRDDIVDITDFDVVAWIRQEMRFMLEEEVARAGLIGDGRDVGDEDKIDEDKIRPVATDDEFYVTTVYVNVGDASSSYNEIIDTVILNRSKYKGRGTPNFYTTEVHIGKFLTLREPDTGKRMYRTLADVAAELRVGAIIPVEVMEDEPDIVGIIVNPSDYTYGATRGGEVTTFDDFDIDYNQYKYLIETRLCGCLTLPKSAIVIRSVAAAAALVTPNAPTFVEGTGVVTIVATTGVVYKNADTLATLTAGAQSALAPGATLNVVASPASASYYFGSSDDDEWSFTRPA